MEHGFRWARYYGGRGALVGAGLGATLLVWQAFTDGLQPPAYPSAMTVSFILGLPSALVVYPAWALFGEQLPASIRSSWFFAMAVVMPAANGLFVGYLVACVRVVRESRLRERTSRDPATLRPPA